MLNVKLLVVGGETESTEFQLQLPATVGRNSEATVNLSHPLVSRRHCELVELGGRLVVRDLGSLNGTFVGSERVEEAVLRPGELLTIGTVTFRAVYELAASADMEMPLVAEKAAGDSMAASHETTASTKAAASQETVRQPSSQDTDTLRPVGPLPDAGKGQQVRVDAPTELTRNSPHHPPVDAPR